PLAITATLAAVLGVVSVAWHPARTAPPVVIDVPPGTVEVLLRPVTRHVGVGDGVVVEARIRNAGDVPLMATGEGVFDLSVRPRARAGSAGRSGARRTRRGDQGVRPGTLREPSPKSNAADDRPLPPR